MTARLLSCTSFHVLLNIYIINLRKDSASPIDFTQNYYFHKKDFSLLSLSVLYT